MSKARRFLVWGLAAIVAIALVAVLWAYAAATGRYDKTWAVHASGFPIPVPLDEGELAALRAERVAAGASATDPLAAVDLDALALERAIDRGRHLVESRTSCHACHGKDFGGAAVIDVALVGRWIAPNLTSGQGSVTKDFTANDWDRAVRHGVRRNGRTSSMPSQEFSNLSDRELSDIVAYIRSKPPVDRDLGPVRLGPVLWFVIATDPTIFVAEAIDHHKPHAREPPAAAPTVELGQHITAVCRGCHGPNLSGGKVAGDPDMPIVANLTPHESGLGAWSEGDFIRAMREGKRRDGTAIDPAMPWRIYSRMTDTELKAVWAYLRTVPPREKGNR